MVIHPGSASADDASSIAVTVGHATDQENQTGCTAILFSQPALCAVDVRGGAPGTRETDLLQPGSLVQRVDAILLTGGSAFGLSAADGVMSYLRDQGRGFPTSAGPVPIVPAAVLFDLSVGNPVAPNAHMGMIACEQATAIEIAPWGRVGAGRGATVANITGSPIPGGIGWQRIPFAGGSVTAIAVVNALGVVPRTAMSFPEEDVRSGLLSGVDSGESRENTTLVALLVDAPAGKDALIQLAISAHDGIARAIVPCHTPFDGDLVFSVGLQAQRANDDRASLALCIASELATEAAIRNAVWSA
jgi:L-aminopeptidase/D-esterase-like protein